MSPGGAFAPVGELTRRLPDGGADIVDVYDVDAALAALGITDHTARARYGLPSVHALSRVLLAHLGRSRRVRTRRRPPGAAALAARYLGPACAVVAAAPVLRPLGPAVAAAFLLMAWPAALALGHAGRVARRRAGRTAAARVIGGGFAGLAAAWCGLAAGLPGPAPPAATAGVTALAAVAALTAAPVLGRTTELVRWSVPLCVLAVGQLTPVGFAAGTAARTAAAATLLAAARVLAPAAHGDATPGGPRPASRPAAALRRTVSHGLLGLACAAGLLWLHRSGHAPAPDAAAALPPLPDPPPDVPGATAGAPPATGLPAATLAVLPVLAAVPLADALAGWHAVRLAGVRAAAESVHAYRRRLRRLAVTTVAGLLPLPAAGAALLAAAHRTAGSARDAALALSAGCLFGGIVAAALVLAARGRPLLGGTLAAAAPLAASWWPRPGPQAWLTAACATGLALVLVRPALRRGGLG